jgi:hypothetical protein
MSRADERLIHLDHLILATQRLRVLIRHSLSNPMAQEPSGLVSDSEGPVQLVR